MILAKPAFGSTCNGCGFCCKAIPCVLARDLIGAREGPCPALEFEDGRYWCGLVRNPSQHIYGLRDKPWADGPIRSEILATGAFGSGCDSDDPLPSERPANTAVQSRSDISGDDPVTP